MDFTKTIDEENDTSSFQWATAAKNHSHAAFSEDSEKEWKGDFYFIHGADPQYGLIDRYILKLETPNWDKEIALTEETVKMVNKMRPKPKFFVLCGDLCDAFFETPELRAKQELSFKSIFNKLDKDIPIICVCGNHDCENQPSYKTIELYRSSFGDDYYSFWAGGIFFIVINSQYYFDPTLVPDLLEEQEKWLDKQLDLYSHSNKTESVGPVIFQHIPWFVGDPNDKTPTYFSIPYERRMKMLEKLSKAGVKYIFCGHLHRNASGVYNDLNIIVSSAIGGQIGEDKSGIRIVKVHSNVIEHKYYAIADIPDEVAFNEN